MKITGTNDYNYTEASSKKSDSYKNHSEFNMAEVFKSEVLNWKEKIKDKITEELDNDEKKNIKMSEKQWCALMEKVDNAIKYKLDVKQDEEKADSTIQKNGDK